MSAMDRLALELERNAPRLVSAAVRQADTDWRATAWMFDRVYGKPKEQLEVTGGLDLTAMPASERSALAARALSLPGVIDLLPEAYRARALELAAAPTEPPADSDS